MALSISRWVDPDGLSRRQIVAGGAIVSLAGCSGVERRRSIQPADTLIRLADDEAKGLDPQLFSDLATTRIATEQFEGLTRLNAQGVAEPGLAEGWSSSPDGLAWRFVLRSGLRFSDRHPIRADLFPSVWRRMHDAAIASPLVGLFASIKNVDAVDQRTIQVLLHHPFPQLPELMAHPAMAALPLHIDNWQAMFPVVASGAYRVTAWHLQDRLELEANPAWHGGRPPIARVIWKPTTDTLTAMRIFLAGEADITADFPSSRMEALRATLGKQVRVAPYRGSYYFAFNTRRPPFHDPQVRRALSLAVDREWLARRLIATGVEPCWSPVPPLAAGAGRFRPDWSSWPASRRLAEASRLLEEAGYGTANPLRFTIRFNSDTDHRRTSVALAAMWKPLGVEAGLLNSEASLHFASLRRGDFDLARSGWIGDVSAPENFLGVHRPSAGQANYSGFADARYEAALDKALHVADPAQRLDDMRAAEATLSDAAPILPLWSYVSKSLVSKRVGGWQDNPANVHPSRTLWLNAL